MRIKADFVTNSSSETIGVVLADSATVGALVAGLLSIFKACKDSASEPPVPVDSGIMDDASSMAQEIAQAALKEAEQQEQIVKDAYAEAEGTLDAARNSLEREMAECKKAWEESEKTADKSDPGYERLKQQYEEYTEYLKNQMAQADYQKQMVEYERAQRQADLEARGEWVKQRQADYIAVKEEKALLQGVLKGYSVPGYNAGSVRDRLKQLEERENELSQVLAENNGSIDYAARDRGAIGPSAESRALNDKIRAERERFEKEKEEADAERRAKLEAEMNKNIAEFERQAKRANRFDMATKAAEGIQYGADLAVEGLSHVTGPAGQQIKLAYTAGKAVASGMGEGMADPKNAAKHLAKGILSAGTEVLKDKFGGSDKPWQAAATGILNEGLQSGLDASIKGEDVTDAIGKGLTKGVFDAGTDSALDAIKGKLPIPKGSSVDVGDYSVGRILSNNPLTKGLAKTTVREAAGSQIKDAVKGKIVDKIGKEGGFVDPEDGD